MPPQSGGMEIYMKKQLKVILSLVLVSTCMLSQVQYTNAETINSKVVISENLEESSYLLRGDKPPTGTSYVNLSKSDYIYQIDEMKVKVFTNSLFSGVTGIDVYVGSISIDKNGMANESEGITVSLYDGKKLVSSKSVGVGGRKTVSFTGLKASTKYHIAFSKLNDTQIYVFSGTISES